MYKHLQRLLLLLMVALIPLASYAENAMRGWYYYDDPQLSVESALESVPVGYKSYRDFNQALKEQFEEVQDRAIYAPTPQNIQAYNEALRMISNNATRFGLLSVTKNWQDPNSGTSIAAPNGAGLQFDLDNQRRQIGEIVKRYAIFYFIADNCKYCSIEANELKRMEYTYNITVKVITMDGSTLPQYPKPTPDNGISKKLKVSAPGEILAFDSINNQTTVLGFGYIHFDQLIQRIQTLFISGTANWNQYLNQPEPIMLNRSNS